MKTNVGELRRQSALEDSDTPVIVITGGEKLEKLLNGKRLKVVEFYPDTTDGEGKWNSAFKIKVVLSDT